MIEFYFTGSSCSSNCVSICLNTISWSRCDGRLYITNSCYQDSKDFVYLGSSHEIDSYNHFVKSDCEVCYVCCPGICTIFCIIPFCFYATYYCIKESDYRSSPKGKIYAIALKGLFAGSIARPYPEWSYPLEVSHKEAFLMACCAIPFSNLGHVHEEEKVCSPQYCHGGSAADGYISI